MKFIKVKGASLVIVTLIGLACGEGPEVAVAAQVVAEGAMEVDSRATQEAAAITAVDISSQKNDQEVVRNIRKELVRDKSLSTVAQNVTIVARDGKVLVRGTVKDLTEKKRVLETATRLATGRTVEESLELKR